PAVTQKVLAEHAAALEARLAAMQQAIDVLYTAVDAPASHTPVHRRHDAASTVLAVEATVTEAEFESFLERARASLFDAAYTSGAVVTGPFGGCSPALIDDNAQDVIAFVPLAEATMVSAGARRDGVHVSELVATDVAVLVHIGGYETLEDSY